MPHLYNACPRAFSWVQQGFDAEDQAPLTPTITAVTNPAAVPRERCTHHRPITGSDFTHFHPNFFAWFQILPVNTVSPLFNILRQTSPTPPLSHWN